jgi:hypothetical protein
VQLVEEAMSCWASVVVSVASLFVSLTEKVRCGAQPLTAMIGMEIFAVALPDAIVTVPGPAV